MQSYLAAKKKVNAMTMIVSELSKQSGVPAHVIRYYSRIGLLTPERNPDNGYKIFSEKDVERIQFIRKAQSIGFSLDEINQILGYDQQSESPCSMVRQGLRRHIKENQRQIDELIEKRGRMTGVLSIWDAMPDQDLDAKSICHLIDQVML